MISNLVRVRVVAAEAVGAFYPTLLDWSKTALEREVSLHGSKDRDDTGTSCLTCLPNKQAISNMTGNQKTPTRYVDVKGWSNSICDVIRSCSQDV